MFKKFGKLVVPFMLTSLSPLLINSPSNAASTYWTEWTNCNFSWHDYTPWSAKIVTRSGGGARPEQASIGNGNSEHIAAIYVWDSWDTSTGRHNSENTYSESLNGATETVTNTFSNLTWISKQFTRYVNVEIVNKDGRYCTSEHKI